MRVSCIISHIKQAILENAIFNIPRIRRRRYGVPVGRLLYRFVWENYSVAYQTAMVKKVWWCLAVACFDTVYRRVHSQV